MSNTAPSQSELAEAAYGFERAAGGDENRTQRRSYSILQFCELYGISRSQAYVEIAGGRLKIRKVGRRTLIAAEDAEAWFAACAVEPTAA